VAPTGPPILVQDTPWSTVLRLPTADGYVYAKANGPGQAYEGPLVAALAARAPERVPVPLAVHPDRPWMLLSDGGQTLRATLAGRWDGAAWERMLAEYADLQRAVTEDTDALLALGVPDGRPEWMPGGFADLLADPVVRAGLTAGQQSALDALRPAYGDWCAALVAGGIRATIQHDDLHDANVLVDAAGGHRFFDWGDACIAHPFGSLLVALRLAAHRYGLPARGPELRRLRDAYLEVWTGSHPGRTPGELIALAGAACQVATVGRALAWQRALIGADPSALAEHADAVPGWLATALEPEPF
jgi:hypothetical protein